MPGASEHGISVQLDVNAIGKLNALLLLGYTHCLLTYSYKGYAGRVDICCSVNIKATIKASRVITVTAIAGNSY